MRVSANVEKEGSNMSGSGRSKMILMCVISLVVSLALFKTEEMLKTKREALILPPPAILSEIWLPHNVNVEKEELHIGDVMRVYISSLDEFRQRFPTGGTISLYSSIRIYHEKEGVWYISPAQYQYDTRNPWGRFWVSVKEVKVEDGRVVIYPQASGGFPVFIFLLTVFSAVGAIIALVFFILIFVRRSLHQES